MIMSMTGFGSTERVTEKYSLKIEIKTLNSKFFDPIVKIPKEFAPWEMEIKSELEKGLKRGKINLSIDFQIKQNEDAPVDIDKKLFQKYFVQLKELSEAVGGADADLFKLAFGMPNVVMVKDGQQELLALSELKSILGEAIGACSQFRTDEGEKLKIALSESLDKIATGLEEVKEIDPQRIAAVKDRLQQSLADIQEKVQVDPNRFEQELIYYIEKLDINEEKVRLASHLDYFKEALSSNESASNGKRLGFISQEIGREINTIGSKANYAPIQRVVVTMKEELEKIKEQVLNVL
ncbi:MAG: YicC family protein [Cyclobacteriaceae bacterium]